MIGATTSGTPPSTSSRELETGERQHHQAADHQQQVAYRHRCRRADDGLEHRRVVGEPRNHVAGAGHLEEAGRKPQQVIEHRAPQVRGNTLAQPRDEVEARVGCGREHDDHRQRDREHSIELRWIPRGKAAIDDKLETLPERKHCGGSEQQRDPCVQHLPAIRLQEAHDACDRPQRGQRRNLRGGFEAGVGAGHRGSVRQSFGM